MPARDRRGSSARGGHTPRAYSRASLQTCIPTSRTTRHTPVPRGGMRNISRSVLTFHRSRPARLSRRLEREANRKTNFSVDRERRLEPPWRVLGTRDFSGAVRRPQCASRFRASSRLQVRRLGRALSRMLFRSTPGALRGRNSPTIEVGQSEGSTRPTCVVPGSTTGRDPGSHRGRPPPSGRSIFTACSERTRCESPTMGKVGVSIDRMSSESQSRTFPSSSFTLAIGVG